MSPRCTARDCRIGWSSRQRRARLFLVAGNTRFLILRRRRAPTRAQSRNHSGMLPCVMAELANLALLILRLLRVRNIQRATKQLLYNGGAEPVAALLLPRALARGSQRTARVGVSKARSATSRVT